MNKFRQGSTYHSLFLAWAAEPLTVPNKNIAKNN